MDSLDVSLTPEGEILIVWSVAASTLARAQEVFGREWDTAHLVIMPVARPAEMLSLEGPSGCLRLPPSRLPAGSRLLLGYSGAGGLFFPTARSEPIPSIL